MKTMTLALATALTFSSLACSGAVDDDRSTDEGSGDGAGRGSGNRGGEGTEGGPSDNGLPCSRAHGTATLANYTGENYAVAGYSFELASQDPAVTRNAPDVYYERNVFMVGGDRDTSFLVDLGEMELRDAPATVEPDAYPTGTWGKHDAIQAHPGHAYYLRGKSWHGRITAAFRVTAIDPGRQVSLEWVRSSDPDRLVIPFACLAAR